MNKLGSGDNGEFTFLDIISVFSFLIGLLNYDENLTQRDKQELQDEFSRRADLLLEEIHKHLEEQDYLLQKILKEINNDHE